MEVKIMIVPGKICRVDLGTGATVLDACHQAESQIPGVGWVELANDREVRVQNRKFSNTEDTPDGFYGNIHTTALSDGDVILILTKIKGNSDAVLTCIIDGAEYALETPVEAHVALTEAAGIDLADVDSIRINGETAEFDRLVGNGDRIEVVYRQPEIEVTTAEDIFSQARQYIAGLETTIEALQNQLTELENAEPPEPAPTAIFGHLGGQLEVIELEGDETVQDILDENRDLGEYEVVFYNGQPLSDDPDEVYVRDGDSILIVPTTKNGRRVKFLIEE